VVRVIRRQHIDRGREASATARGLVRLLCVLAMFASATFVVPAPAAAPARTDCAAVLLEAARRFERQGRTDIADALYEMILERFGGTAAAEQVRQIRAAMPTERRVRTGAVELQVCSRRSCRCNQPGGDRTDGDDSVRSLGPGGYFGQQRRPVCQPLPPALL
jgi:hypothetical protein